MAKKSTNIDDRVPKFIVLTGRFLYFISPFLAERFARKLFITPIKHKIPKREFHMEEESVQTKLFVPSINKEIVVYSYGNSDKKILLVHGWSGRGTQLVKIADAFKEKGFSTISFDAPAHGKSGTKTTLMLEFIESILEVEKLYGPFEFAIGHSLGGMSILNAVKKGLQVQKAVVIGSGNSVVNIVNTFVEKIGLPNKVAVIMKNNFEKKYQFDMESFSAYVAAKDVKIPVLVVHDNDDDDIPVSEAYHLADNLINKEIMITNKLGHRKILGDSGVINKIIEFLLIKK
ncbi:alpha/beta hydrolase family protein [Flavobacterium urocaniciphilum]|uniref:Pimeloyl-ACP methyl ester carboxylesterase n=1 Tax=Flavobacterium urocaniciphilum TaxID=1299341 RepID=A0A1H8Z0B6_9FLAO|nr:alpha/beta hydrolase [Flavobacterium urocaniciphilum]SEP57786.1 Pimeloyl-ACP methyl ester carboxylesterase [Flavobacterium urocaniciphilum]